jgi:ParB family transcriptional regulator, chromosome partitioning protein
MGNEKPKRLGRGLSALLDSPAVVSEEKQTTAVAEPEARRDGLVQVEVGRIQPSPFQPRKVFDRGALERLADSIRRSGLMQPVVVRPKKEVGEYELVAGERRWRAAQMAGLPTIPAIVRELTDEVSAEWGIVENVQREDLNPIEKAQAFRSLVNEFGMTQAQIAERIGQDRSSIANTLRLLELEPAIQVMIESGRLSAGHGRALLGTPAGAERMKLAEQACDDGWSVRRLERTAAAAAATENAETSTQMVSPVVPEYSARTAARADLERQLGEFLGTKVTVTTERGGKRGKLMIEFYGLEHFDGLLSKFGFEMK